MPTIPTRSPEDSDRPFWSLEMGMEEYRRLLENGGDLSQEQKTLLQPDELEEHGHLRTLVRVRKGLPL